MMTNLIVIEHTQSITFDESNQPKETMSVSVRLAYEAFSSGWIRENFGGRSGPTDFLVLAGIANHARPLHGDDLQQMIDLGVATQTDKGRLYARVTNVGLADELGMERETVGDAARRLAEKGLIRICPLPDNFRDSKGQFGGNKAYIIAGTFVIKQYDGDDRAGLTRTVIGQNGNDRAGLTRTVIGQNGNDRAGLTATNIEEEEEEEDDIFLFFLNASDAAGNPAREPLTDRERAGLRGLLDLGCSADDIKQIIARNFQTARKGQVVTLDQCIRSVRRYWREHQNPNAQNTAGTTSLSDATSTAGSNGLPDAGTTAADMLGISAAPATGEDELNRVYTLLQAASIHDMTGLDNVCYDQRRIRLGLHQFLVQGFSPDEVYDAVIAAVSRCIPPDRLVSYVKAVLDNGRKDARERERLGRVVDEAVRTNWVVNPDMPPEPEVDPAAERLWQQALDELKMQMTQVTFDTWLRPARLVDWTPAENGTPAQVTIGAPNEYIRDWLQNRMYTPIRRTLSGIAGVTVRMQVIVNE